MKTARLMIFVLCAVLVMGSSALAAGLKLGDTAPMSATKMKNVDDREASIADVKGPNGTLVIFTCNHCPFAKAWEVRISTIGNAAQKNGVGVIAINANDPSSYAEDRFEEMQKRAKERGFQFPYVVDATSDVAREFGATRTPECYLFDKNGKLIYHGAVDDNYADAAKVDKHYLEDAINALVAGKDVPVKESKAVGCTIKLRAKG
ncbi:MAG: thioredoxin family protein [Verrucomicrobiia bacterium]